MSVGRSGWLLAIVAGTVLTGCVDRRFVVESNVPGAQISVDGVPIGPAPTDARWEYAGCYEFLAVAPGYEPLVQKVYFKPKWYQYPPFDLFAEVFWPGRIEDVRRVRLTLEPTRPVDQVQLLTSADALRARGAMLPPSTVPDEAPTRPANPPSPIPPTPRALPIPANLDPPTRFGLPPDQPIGPGSPLPLGPGSAIPSGPAPGQGMPAPY
jgi:hypothetical protein